MTILYIIIAILAATLVVIMSLWLSSRKHESQLIESKNEAIEERHRVESALNQDIGHKNTQINTLSAELAAAREKIKGLEVREAENKEQLEKKLEEQQASFRMEFKNLASDILGEQSKQFKQTNKDSIDQQLNPFKESLTEFKKRVEDIHTKQSEQSGELKKELDNLMKVNRQISDDANNLTRALKGDSKVQGDWGEMILDTILDSSNLVRGVHYHTQENLKDESGANVRPDVILDLPGKKQIIIDSKVSLTAFVGYTEAEEDAARKKLLDDHIASVRKHVTELGSKRYQELVDSPDFVIMFIPNEPAFLAAVQNDGSIWEDAYRKKVIISSPTNLFALLKLVDDLWKRDNQSRNAIEIADEGSKLYDKFVGFVETLETIGKNISAASSNYDKAMGQLKTGSGNLIGRTEKLRKLGIKASKSLPSQMVDQALNEHDELPEEREE
jgi:DNA recombination protein RmuC